MNELFKQLRPYQLEAGNAIMDSVQGKKGHTFTVEIARQGGKNELSSQIELMIMILYGGEPPMNFIKCSPTFKPQTIVSMMRLKEKLTMTGLDGLWTTEMGYMIRLGNCRGIFLSGEDNANVVGNTAHLLLEVDEAQDVSEEKYTKEFKPMGSTTNVTNVLYGTTWDDSTLLEKSKQNNLELERKDGVKRHYRYDWQEVAKYNPDYLSYVEGERARLGENHPLFMTQYRLLPIRGGGGFLSGGQRAQLQGTHDRCKKPRTGKLYIAGIDLAGESETGLDDYIKSLKPKQDSTVFTIAELIQESGNFGKSTQIKIVEQYHWTGRKHPEMYATFIDLIKNVWKCRYVVVDATGIGQPVASFLKDALGSRIIPFAFTAASKTELGFNLLAAINSGSLKMYKADNSPEYEDFWLQMERAKSFFRASQTMNFYVDPSEGHDDYLMSLALLVEAANQYSPRTASGSIRSG